MNLRSSKLARAAVYSLAEPQQADADWRGSTSFGHASLGLSFPLYRQKSGGSRDHAAHTWKNAVRSML